MTLFDQPFVSCDWGTTSFRLRFVSATGDVEAEIRESSGAKALYEQALRRGAKTESERAPTFAGFIFGKLEEIARKGVPVETHPPLVISGMASSTIGWKELPYSRVPLPLNGSQLYFEKLDWHGPKWLGPTWLLSGVATECDIMRGEETEIIGLLSGPGLESFRKRSLLILPGTHSKHVYIANNRLEDFRTIMTGELFEVLGKHSILRASVDLEGSSQSLDKNNSSFCDGVQWGAQHGLAAALFRVRTRAVLDGAMPLENTSFLSGVLIGAELQHLSSIDRPVLLASGRAVSRLYSLALKTLAPRELNWMDLSADQVERATVIGHANFLKHAINKVE